MTSTIRADQRRQVQERAAGRCEYCRTSERLTGYALEIDHIVPQARKGASSLSNLCFSCRRCNAHKSYRIHALDPHSGEQVPLFNPRIDVWTEHFTWGDDGTQIIGQTSAGRATIEALRMNDPLIVRARALWVSAGWHPPTV